MKLFFNDVILGSAR